MSLLDHYYSKSSLEDNSTDKNIDLSELESINEELDADEDTVDEINQTKETTESLVNILSNINDGNGVSVESARLLNVALMHITNSIGVNDDFFTISEESNSNGLVLVDSNIARCEQVLTFSEESLAETTMKFFRSLGDFFISLEKINGRLKKSIAQTADSVKTHKNSIVGTEDIQVTDSRFLMYKGKLSGQSIIDGLSATNKVFEITNDSFTEIRKQTSHMKPKSDGSTRVKEIREKMAASLTNFNSVNRTSIIGGKTVNFNNQTCVVKLNDLPTTTILSTCKPLTIDECNQILKDLNYMTKAIDRFVTIKEFVNKLLTIKKSALWGTLDALGTLVFWAGVSNTAAILSGAKKDRIRDLDIASIAVIANAPTTKNMFRKSTDNLRNDILGFTRRLSVHSLKVGFASIDLIYQSLETMEN